MRLLKLKDLVNNCPCSYGDDIGKYDDVVPVVKVSNINGEGYFKNNFEKRSFPSKKLDKLLTQEGDLLVVKSSGSKLNILSGKTAIVNKKLSNNIVSSNFLLRLSPRKDKVFPKYLWYLLNSQFSRNYVKTIVGATTYPNLKWDLYSKHPVPYVDICEQKSIVQKLDIANSLRQKRKEQLALLYDYLKSVFLDMFGDPVMNEKRFQIIPIRKIIAEVKYGTNKKANPDDGKFPILRMNNITYSGEWNLTNLKYIDLETSEIEKYTVKKGDLLFNRTNSKELVGKTAVFESNKVMAYAGYLIRCRFNEEKVKPIYVSNFLNSKYGKAKLMHMCKNIVGMANINAQELQDIKITLPPIDLQNKFVSIVEQVEQIKQKMRASLDEMNNHFNSLMQRYFE